MVWKSYNLKEDKKEENIHKKGDYTKCNNFRPICLSTISSKAYTKIIEGGLRKMVSEVVEDEQAVYRASN